MFAPVSDTAEAQRLVTASEGKRVVWFACLAEARPAAPIRADELFCSGRIRRGRCAVWAVAMDRPNRGARRLRRSESFGFGCVSNQQ
jgi:hypothetical protein